MASRPGKQAQSDRSGPSASRRALAVGAALAVVTIAVYARVAGCSFINLDDNDYVTQNPRVQSGITWKGIVWAFAAGHAANWHPLTWLSHMLDCQLFGMNPAGHHLTSLGLHVASTLLLFRLLLRMTQALWPSAFVAAVFGLHPLHVESVAWVAERKDVLSAFFWILTTLAYVSWVEKRGTRRYLAVVGFFALGLLSKPMLVTLPFTLLLLDVWPLRRNQAPWSDPRGFVQLVREKVPLFLLAAASSIVTFLVQRVEGGVALGEWKPPGLPVENAVVAYVTYLGKALVPIRLLIYYPHPVDGYSGLQVAGSELLLAAATVVAWRERNRRPWVAIGWLWFLGTLLPVIGIVQVGSQALADRYAYVPLIGLSASVAFSAAEIARRSNTARITVAALLLLAAVAWTGLTWRQVGFWEDDRTLFGHVAEVMPENHLAHGILGNVHLREHRFDEAMAEYRTALRLRPSYAQAYSNMGMVLELSGQSAEAIERYETALRWSPDLAEAHQNLGSLLASQGRLGPAIAHLEAAVKSNPDLVEAHMNLGSALALSGRLDEGIAHLEKAVELKPGSADAKRKLEAARASRGAR
jgi:predicted negative regulator of RcsB-dependent stress response